MSINEPKQTKAEKREAARAARQQASAAEQAAAERKRRLWILGGLGAVIVAVVIGVVVAQGGGDSTDTSKPPNGTVEVNEMFKGVPQQGNVAGKPDAPLTLVEFADLKCPVCRQFDVGSMPTIIEKYVKTGKLRVDIRLLHFVGEQQNPGDSEQAARFAAAAASQNKMWPFVQLFYFNQQDETTDYVNDSYLTWLGDAVGIDSKKALADSKSKAVTAQLDTWAKQFAANSFTGTPSFLLGKTGGELKPFQASGAYDNPESFTIQIDEALKGK